MKQYSLVLDTVPMSFALATNLSLSEAKKEHAKWLKKVKEQKWVKIPADVPVHFATESLIALRVVEITEQHQAMEQAQKNPAMQRLFDGSRGIAPDFDDNGYL